MTPTRRRDARILLGRREALVGVAALSWGCSRPRVAFPIAAGACVLTPEQVEGPYYLDDAKLRADIHEGKPGVPLWLALLLVDARSCRPVEGAAVDVWHCDSGGTYSGFAEASARPPPPGEPPPPHARPDNGHGHDPPGRPPGDPGFGAFAGPPPARRSDPLTFLRGVQLSDGAGAVQFRTIYPGWYPGRAVHIHLRVRTGGTLAGAAYAGGHVAHTGQLYFPEGVSDQVFRVAPYASHAGDRLLQADDPIFADGGVSGMVTLSPSAPGVDAASGYLATATVALDPTATPPHGPMR